MKSENKNHIPENQEVSSELEHHHHHCEDPGCTCCLNDDDKSSKSFLFCRLGISLVLLIISYLPFVSSGLALVLDIAAYVIAGYDLLMEAIESTLHRDFFNEQTLMSLAAIGAILIGDGHEAVIIALFAQVGELLEEKAVGRSQRSVEKLLKLTPDTVNIQEDHAIKSVPAESIRVGDRFTVFAGERIALDGVVISGCTELDVSSLTGESLPVPVAADSEVLAGSINLSGTITVEATKEYAESAAAKIIQLVQDARKSKGLASRFVTRFSKIYTPCVFLGALIVGIGIPLAFHLSFSEWIHKALLFLVVSCPCALVISIPLSYFAGIGGASRHGILIKNASIVDKLANATTAAFDKTGTLTTGHFSVKEILPAEGVSQKYLLEIAAYAEANSNHPLAQSLRSELELITDPDRISRYEEIPGKGCVAELTDRSVCIAGNAILMQECRIMDTLPELSDAVIHFSDGRQYCGCVTFTDTVREDAAEAMKALNELSVSRRIMITGDTRNSAMQVAEVIGINEVNSSCLPEDKLRIMRELRRRMPKGETVLYAGDGINDAPVLSAADVGIAMGGLGADAAIEAADVVITTDEIRKVPEAIRLAKNTKKIIIENIAFTLGVKFLVMLFAMFNAAPMLLAVFADVGVSLLAILNSIRALKK